MKKTTAMMLIAGIAVPTAAAFAQGSERGERPGRDGPRHQMMEEIRDGGMDADRFAELVTEHAEARFDRLDADGDGVISREEYLEATGNRIERQFARLDRNEDGLLMRDDRPFRGGRHGPSHGRDGAEQQQETPAEAPAAE